VNLKRHETELSELTGNDIKIMIQLIIDMKQEIKPQGQSLREVEDHLTVLEALQCASEFDYRRRGTQRNNCRHSPGSISK
jgi:hypothetical protein